MKREKLKMLKEELYEVMLRSGRECECNEKERQLTEEDRELGERRKRLEKKTEMNKSILNACGVV